MQRCEEDEVHVAESIKQWLEANGVDWDNVAGWPEIVIADDDQTFQVEQFQRDGRGRPEIMHGPGLGDKGGLVRLNTYPHQVKIDPDLLESYLYTRPQALEYAKWVRIKELLRFNPPTVMLRGGETLIFTTRDRMSVEDVVHAQKILQESLPGVNVTVMAGIDSVMAGIGPVSL